MLKTSHRPDCPSHHGSPLRRRGLRVYMFLIGRDGGYQPERGLVLTGNMGTEAVGMASKIGHSAVDLGKFVPTVRSRDSWL